MSERRSPPPWIVEELIFAVPSVTAFLMTIITLASGGANALEAIHALHCLRFSDFGLPAGRYNRDWPTASDGDRITRRNLSGRS
jgi:hypothetical protein